MTREEAIGILNETQVVYFAPNGKKKVQEALDMAIDALSEPNARLTHDLTHACVDLISREDAIEAVRKELVCDGRHETHDKTCRFIADVLLSALPSVKGGDAEMNETKSPYMQQSPNDGADLISRDDVFGCIEDAQDGSVETYNILSQVFNDVLALPSADRPHGEEDEA